MYKYFCKQTIWESEIDWTISIMWEQVDENPT